MKAYVFVTEDGEAAQRLVHEAGERGLNVQLYVGDGSESVSMRQMYDVTTRPAALVTLDDGTYVHMWQGALPTVAELNHAMRGM